MKKIKLGARRATLVVVSAAGLLAAAQSAQAQVWFETRTWPQARYYEEVPPVYRAPPRYVAPAALPRRAIRQIVEGQGFEIVGAMQFTGDAYIVQALDERGRVRRLVVDARDGEIVESASLVPQRVPPVDVGRGPYVISPGVDLPPGRLAPRGDWRGEGYGFPTPPPAVNLQERRARERFARQTPDGFDGPRDRMDDVNIAPGFGGAAPAPQGETSSAAPNKPRAVKKPQAKSPPKKQAARTPSPPQAAKAEPATPEAAKSEPKSEAAKSEAAKSEAAKSEKMEAAVAPATRTEQPRASVAPPQVAKHEAATRNNSVNNSVLRRPSQKADGGATTGERKGVAGGPTISSGAEPQRNAPRVVYPGPGATAPPADGQD